MRIKLAALTGVLTGIALLALGRGESPVWLRCAQVLIFSTVALLYGFTAFVPQAPAWLSSRPIAGMAMVYMGVAVLFVPSNIVTSAFFLAIGTRLIMAPDVLAVRVIPHSTLARHTNKTEIMQ